MSSCKVILAVLLCGWCIAFPRVAAGDIINGDFSNGLTGWMGGTSTVSEDVYCEGGIAFVNAWLAWLPMEPEMPPMPMPGQAFLSQVVEVPASAEFLVFDANVSGYGTGWGNTNWLVKFSGVTYYDETPDEFQIGWRQIEIPVPPELRGMIGVHLGFLVNGGDGSVSLQLDNIRFEVPEPTALSLLALGGLAVARRRWRGR